MLEFKRKFIRSIKKGTKKHTIRKDKENFWRFGYTIEMVTDLGTKDQEIFAKAYCTAIQKIKIIHYSDMIQVDIDGELFGGATKNSKGKIYLYDKCLEDLAKNDGFESLEAFFEWFNTDYSGKIIHWTNLKY